MHTAQFELHADIEQRHWWFVARRRILRDVIATVLPPNEGHTIVDVGCGTGANLASLADRYECVGIDSSSDAIRLARVRFPQVRFVHGLAPRDLGPVMDLAGLVLLTDVLEHVPDDFQMFSELLAASQPGTLFLITVPANERLWSGHDVAFGHYRRYDRPRLEQIWQGLSATTLFTSYYNARLYPLVLLARTWSQLRGKTAGIAGTDFRVPNALGNRLLRECFASESRPLVRLARGSSARPFNQGVSLMALVRREDGYIEPRQRPDFVTADLHDPAAELVTADE